MRGTDRIIVNTIILYAKGVVSILVSLVSVPLILRSLGQEDYGLYMMLAGVVALLAFLNASMTVSTQRYLSVSFGEKSEDRVNSIFTVSIVLHIAISLVILALLELCCPILFGGFLNIPEGRETACAVVYQMLALSMVMTIITVPFTALLNAKENMLVFSLISISENILRLILAVGLLYYGADKLVVYGIGMAVITFVSSLTTMLYCHYRYTDCRFSVRRYYKQPLMREMVGFTSWNTLGAVSVLCRNQGGAIIVNWFFYAIGNAAYGIANQINGAVNYFSANLQRAINPQIMQSEGSHDRKKLERLTIATSKYSTMMIGFIVVPLIVEMPFILSVWLGEIPDGTIWLSRLTLTLCLISQFSMGLMAYVQAIGKIRDYFLSVSALLLISLPLGYAVYRLGFGIESLVMVFIAVELLCFAVRMYFARESGGLPLLQYLLNGVLRAMLPIVLAGIAALGMKCFLEAGWLRTALVLIIYWTVFGVLAWQWGIDETERQYAREKLDRIIKKSK